MINQDPYFKTKNGNVHNGDCLDVMKELPDNSIDSIVTDPPYALNFMGKGWDKVLPSIDIWKEALRIAKPGATLMAFGGTRTYHRLTCAIEDAGWEIKDCIMWLYGTGFPKSLDIGKSIDKLLGNEREVIGFSNFAQSDNHLRSSKFLEGKTTRSHLKITAPATTESKLWEGWGTALKPAYEPIVIAVKPNDETYANNALEWGVAGINIDGCRVETNGITGWGGRESEGYGCGMKSGDVRPTTGRFPANIIHDGSDEVTDLFPHTKGSIGRANRKLAGNYNASSFKVGICTETEIKDSGSAARFFYCAKSSKSERGENNKHPTVKPIRLIEYLCKLTATPTKGIVLDMFGGSGTTGVACERLKRKYILIEKEEKYCKIIKERLEKEIVQNRLF